MRSKTFQITIPVPSLPSLPRIRVSISYPDRAPQTQTPLQRVRGILRQKKA